MDNSTNTFLTYKEASSLTRYSVGTLRFYVYKDILRENEHYVWPRGIGGRLLFIRENLIAWMTGKKITAPGKTLRNGKSQQ